MFNYYDISVKTLCSLHVALYREKRKEERRRREEEKEEIENGKKESTLNTKVGSAFLSITWSKIVLDYNIMMQGKPHSTL